MFLHQFIANVRHKNTKITGLVGRKQRKTEKKTNQQRCQVAVNGPGNRKQHEPIMLANEMKQWQHVCALHKTKRPTDGVQRKVNDLKLKPQRIDGVCVGVGQRFLGGQT